MAEGLNKNEKDESKREAFGNRFLINDENVFEHNAWDNVEWDEEQLIEAQLKIKNNSSILMSNDKAEKFEKDANEFWNKFYSIHENKFFKDRNWLFTEFDELLLNTDKDNENNKHYIFEVGCGVGNTIFPILRSNKNKNYFLYCCDFSSTAIDILKTNEDYDTNRCHAFVCDITNMTNIPFNENQLDIIVIIFVLSAIKPEKVLDTIKTLVKYLKPGGKILFRDYGLYDMAQLRFKNGQCVEKNFYVRGDGTFVYFFTKDEIDKIFTDCGLVKVQNIEDKRLQVNRGKQLKMYRVWIQAKYMKPLVELN